MFDMLHDAVGMLARQSWQLVPVFLAVLLLSWLSRRSSAHWRYLLWLVVLAKCLVPPAVTVPLGLWPTAQPSANVARPIDTPQAQPQPDQLATASPVDKEPAKPIAVTEGTIPRQDAAALPQPGRPEMPSAAGATIDQPPGKSPAMGGLAIAWQWAGPVWLTGLSAYLLAACFKAWRIRRQLHQFRQPIDGDLANEIESLAARLGLRRRPSVYAVEHFSQPFVWGVLRGSIYLPETFAQDTNDSHRRAVLAHELAHVVRWDAAGNLFQVILQGVFFFHPLIWWANRQVRREREKCCDEMAIAALSEQPRRYSQALLNTLINSRDQAVPVLAVAGPVKNLEERIRNIMRDNRTFQKRPGWTALAAAATLACVTLATGLVLTAASQAQTSQSTSAKAASTQPAAEGVPSVVMPDGTQVQLLAVTNLHEEPQKWWRPDGTELPAAPVALPKQGPGEHYQYAMVYSIPPYGSASETTQVASEDSKSEQLDDSLPLSGGQRVFWINFGSKAPKTANVRYLRASGEWEPLATCPLPIAVGVTVNDILFKPPVADNGHTNAELFYLSMPGDALRLEAVLKDGRKVGCSSWTSSGTAITDSLFTFDVPPEQIASLELMSRPYDTAVFRNVSLQSGEKTQPRATLVSVGELKIPGLEHRRINKLVSDFPATFDLSTPEAAYATINRVDSNDGWRKVSAKSVREAFKNAKDEPPDPQWQAVLEHARIQDVWVWQGKIAIVAAKLSPQSSEQITNPIDIRHLRLEDGQWRNTGNDRRNDMQQVRAMVQLVIKRSMDDDAPQHATEIKDAARQLFEQIQTTNYVEALKQYESAAGRWRDDYWQRLPFSNYKVNSDWPSFALWVCRTFKDNPIKSVELGDVFAGKEKIKDRAGWPTVPYKLTLQDGTVLKGNLAFESNLADSDASAHRWHGMEGIDWHRQYPNGLPKKQD